jgi:hypothetical protein
VRVLVAIATAALLLVGLVAPHHHSTSGGVHECVACAVGGSLEARDVTPRLAPPPPAPLAAVAAPATDPVTGAPLGAIPGQSPPTA